MTALRSTLHFAPDQRPTIDLTAPPIKVPSASNGQVNASCNSEVTVDCLLDLYNAADFKASADVNNSIGVTGYLGEVANFADLQTFYGMHALTL